MMHDGQKYVNDLFPANPRPLQSSDKEQKERKKIEIFHVK